jgi:hypothetical protein
MSEITLDKAASGSTNSLSGSYMEVRDQLHAPHALPSVE